MEINPIGLKDFIINIYILLLLLLSGRSIIIENGRYDFFEKVNIILELKIFIISKIR